MTPEQIEKLRLEADAYAQKVAPFCHPLSIRFAQIRDTEFARLVAQDTWERARNVCFAVDDTGDYVCHTRDDCANAIDAEAAREKA